jgi:hypothetical protein
VSSVLTQFFIRILPDFPTAIISRVDYDYNPKYQTLLFPLLALLVSFQVLEIMAFFVSLSSVFSFLFSLTLSYVTPDGSYM